MYSLRIWQSGVRARPRIRRWRSAEPVEAATKETRTHTYRPENDQEERETAAEAPQADETALNHCDSPRHHKCKGQHAQDSEQSGHASQDSSVRCQLFLSVDGERVVDLRKGCCPL